MTLTGLLHIPLVALPWANSFLLLSNTSHPSCGFTIPFHVFFLFFSLIDDSFAFLSFSFISIYSFIFLFLIAFYHNPFTSYLLVFCKVFFASCINITCMRFFCASNLHLFYFQAIHFLLYVLPVVMSTLISFCACRMYFFKLFTCPFGSLSGM